MTISLENNTQEIKNNKIDKILEKLVLKEDFLKEINNILEKSEELDGKINFSIFFGELEKIKENGQILYKKYGNNDENKIKIVKFILDNIISILKNLNIRKIYNYYPKIEIEKFSKLSSQE